MALVFVTALVPNTSFLGHLCSVAVGYVCTYPFSCLHSPPKLVSIHTQLPLIVPPLTILTAHRRPWLPQDSGTSGKSSSLDRGKIEFARKTSALRFDRSENLWQIWCPALDECSCCTWRWRRLCPYDLHGIDREVGAMMFEDDQRRCVEACTKTYIHFNKNVAIYLPYHNHSGNKSALRLKTHATSGRPAQILIAIVRCK